MQLPCRRETKTKTFLHPTESNKKKAGNLYFLSAQFFTRYKKLFFSFILFIFDNPEEKKKKLGQG